MRRPARYVLLALLISSLGSMQAQTPTDLRLPAVISDHMMIQNGKPTNLWGWAAPQTAIKAEFLDGTSKVIASTDGSTGADGRWSLKLTPPPAGTAGTLRITAGATVKTIQDVLVGEVWLGGGQSNMTYDLSSGNIPAAQLEAAKQEVIAANGAIHFFRADWAEVETPQDDVKGSWFVVNPGNFRGCSAVAWYFAVALRTKIQSPVGMIISAVGGTSVTQWMPKEAMESSPPGPDIERNVLEGRTEGKGRMQQWTEDDNKFKKAFPTDDLQKQNAAFRPSRPWEGPPYPSRLYNGMIHGLAPYTMKGMIWFQADGDMGIPFAYGDLIKSMILAWRADWHDELPFYYVEMNNMREYPPKDPNQGNDALSILRQQQQAALELPQTDVACCIDLSLLEPEPHFPNKEPLGQRLALLAFNNVYGMPCAAHSPAYDSFKVEGNKIRLHFKYAEGLRVRGGGEMIGFEIRGATGPWLWAKGQVDGQDVLVWNDQIPNLTEVHYAWSMNPLISMENGAGLPMRPFSTTTIKP